MTDKQKVSKATREILADLEKRDDGIGRLARAAKADAKAQAQDEHDAGHEQDAQDENEAKA